MLMISEFKGLNFPKNLTIMGVTDESINVVDKLISS